uniref:Uncharacterized protein n=1 Tax=Timema poppense TaxID=170557 RepID=A0A7R9DVD3_TIMPO|nr:unnamed protein product [Timema poppensis]
MTCLIHAAGDRKYRIPLLEPLVISELRVDQDSGSRAIGFGFVAKNASLRGMSGVEVNHIRIDFSENICEYHLSFPRLEIDTEYKVEGKILLLPITGSGNANITISKL